MPKIINSVDLNRMKWIEINKELVNLEYLYNESANITNFISDTFFDWTTTDALLKKKARQKLEILNHTIALPYKIATSKAKFYWKPATNLDVLELKEQVISYVYGGFSVFAIDETDEDWRPIINKYNPEQYVKWVEFDTISTYLRNEKNELYLLIKQFLNDESGIIRNKLYKIIWGIEAWITWNEVPLDTLDITAEMEDEYDMKTNKKLIYTVHDYKLKHSIYGTPQLDLVKPLLNQLNVQLVNIQDQFMKHLQAKLAIQGIDAGKMPKDKEGNILIREAEALFLEHWASIPEYIQNKNDLLKDAMEIIEKFIWQVAVTLSIPSELVGISGQTGTESTESKLLRYSDFIKDIEEIHTSYKKEFAIMFDVVTKIYPNYLKDKTEKEFFYIAEPVMPRDWTALATELNIAVMWGFLSSQTAVKRYTLLEWKELEEEMQKINEEAARSLANSDLI